MPTNVTQEMRVMRSVILLAAGFALCVSAPAVAQHKTADVSGGYTFMKGRFDGENLHGFVGSGAGYFHWFGLVIEGGANLGKSPRRFGGDLDVVYVSVGPRIAFNHSERFTPFAQVLLSAITGAGGENQPGEIGSLATQLGVGADFWRSPRIGIRIGGDYLISESGARYNKVRLQAGIVFRRLR